MTSNRILLFSEGISFCHVVRPLVIGKWIRSLGDIDLVVAAPANRVPFFAEEGFQTEVIQVADPREIYKRLSVGGPIYTIDDLDKYYLDDSRLLDRIEPQVVIADFRFPLLQLSQDRNIPTIGITSASCHPSFDNSGSVPNCFLKPRILPPAMIDYADGTFLGNTVRRQLLKQISRPYQVASRRHKMPVLESFFEYASLGDLCLLSDHPEVMPIEHLRPRDQYTGPLTWHRETRLPDGLSGTLSKASSVVYITVGTQESMDTGFVGPLAKSLTSRGITTVVSRGGRSFEMPFEHEKLFVFNFVNESKLLPLVDLWIYHGRALSTYNGLVFGVPMISIPQQADQHFHSLALERLQVGKLIRPRELVVTELVKLAMSFLEDNQIYDRCRFISDKLASTELQQRAKNRIRVFLKEAGITVR